MQVTQHFGQPIGTSGFRNIVLSGVEVAVLQGNHSKVSKGLGQVGADALCLGDKLLCSSQVALGISQGSEVVVGTCIVGIDLCGGLVDVLLGGRVFGEGSGVEQFLDAELLGIGLQLALNLAVVAANGLVVDGET